VRPDWERNDAFEVGPGRGRREPQGFLGRFGVVKKAAGKRRMRGSGEGAVLRGFGAPARGREPATESQRCSKDWLALPDSTFGSLQHEQQGNEHQNRQ